MKDGICPKCGSGEVFKRKSQGQTTVVLSWIRATYPVNYVCADCGYVEWYIEERKHLDFIREKWEHAISKRKRKN